MTSPERKWFYRGIAVGVLLGFMLVALSACTLLNRESEAQTREKRAQIAFKAREALIEDCLADKMRCAGSPVKLKSGKLMRISTCLNQCGDEDISVWVMESLMMNDPRFLPESIEWILVSDKWRWM